MEAIIAITLGLLLGVVFILNFLIKKVRLKEEREEVREKAQERKLRLLDMLTLYGFVVDHDDRASPSIDEPSMVTHYGGNKITMKIRLVPEDGLDHERKITLAYDPLFLSQLTEKEIELYLKEYLLYLEGVRYDWHGLWLVATVHIDEKRCFGIQLRNHDEISKGFGSLV